MKCKCKDCPLRYRVVEIVNGQQVVDDCHKHCLDYLNYKAECDRKNANEHKENEAYHTRYISMKYANEKHQRKKKNGGK